MTGCPEFPTGLDLVSDQSSAVESRLPVLWIIAATLQSLRCGREIYGECLGSGIYDVDIEGIDQP